MSPDYVSNETQKVFTMIRDVQRHVIPTTFQIVSATLPRFASNTALGGTHQDSSCLAVLALLFFFFPFVFISWRLITLQYCSGFCHTLTWISHGFTCVPHPETPRTSLPIPSLRLFPVHQPRALVSCILVLLFSLLNSSSRYSRALFIPSKSHHHPWKGFYSTLSTIHTSYPYFLYSTHHCLEIYYIFVFTFCFPY